MARSLAVSLATTVFDLATFAICVALIGGAGATLALARWVCGAIGAVSNFALNRRLAFPRSGSRARQLKRYALVATGAVTLATGVWWLLDSVTMFDPRVLHLASAAVVWLTFTYPLLKRWVFTSR